MADEGIVDIRPSWVYNSDAPIKLVSIAAAGDVLMVADEQRNVHVLDARGELLGSMRPGQPVRQLACNRMGSRLAALSGDNIVYAFDREGNLDWRVEFAGKIEGFGFDPPGENVAAISSEGWLHIYTQ